MPANPNAPVTMSDLDSFSQTICRAVGIALAVALDQVGPDARADFMAALESTAVGHYEEDDVGLALELIQAGAEEAPGGDEGAD